MSSGGMSASLTVNRLQMSGPGSADLYQGAEQYAPAKQAQVTLTEIWAEKFADSGVRFHSSTRAGPHTRVEEAMPTFRKIVGRCCAPGRGRHARLAYGRRHRGRGERSVLARPGTARSTVFLRPGVATRPSGVPTWDWCVAQTGVDPEA